MTPSISGQFSGDGTAALQHGQAPRTASHGSTQPGWYEWEHGSVVVAAASASAASPRPRTSSRQTAQSTCDGAASGAGALAVPSPARRATRPAASGAFFFKATAADDEPGPGWLRASSWVGAISAPAAVTV